MRSLLLALSLSFCASAAFAADAVYTDPPADAPPLGDWTGFYAGVQLGGAFGGSSGVFSMDRNRDGAYGDYIAAFDPSQPVCAGDGCGFSGSFDNGVIGGAHVGYDMQFDRFVLGALVDISVTDIGDRQSGFSGTPAFYHIDRELEWLLTARGRLGYVFAPNWMAYATGGLAVGEVKYSFASNTPATVGVSGGGGTEIGYSVGGGVETKLTPRVTLGVEYLYTNLGDSDFVVNLSGRPGTGAGNAFGTGGANSTNAIGSDGDFDFHTVQVKLSYRF